MPWSLKTSGTAIPRDHFRIWTWLQSARAEAHFDFSESVSAGDQAEITYNGSPIITGEVSHVRTQYRHKEATIVPKVVLTLENETQSAISGDGKTFTQVARQILGDDPILQGIPNTNIVRWTTREQNSGWAWESLVRTVSWQTATPLMWRYDARQDKIIVEKDRSQWQEASMPRGIILRGSRSEFDAGDVQSGDLLGGNQILRTETLVSLHTKRSLVEFDV